MNGKECITTTHSISFPLKKAATVAKANASSRVAASVTTKLAAVLILCIVLSSIDCCHCRRTNQSQHNNIPSINSNNPKMIFLKSASSLTSTSSMSSMSSSTIRRQTAAFVTNTKMNTKGSFTAPTATSTARRDTARSYRVGPSFATRSCYQNRQRLARMSMSTSNLASADTDADNSVDNDNSNNNDYNISRDALSQTPLGIDSSSHLLNGLDVYTVYANDGMNPQQKGHPLSLYGIHSKDVGSNNDQDHCHRRPVLMLHGRTWSSVPVYHLLGGENNIDDNDGNDADDESTSPSSSRSLMEALYKKGLQPYALDFRGFGGTPSDETNAVLPNTCVNDVGHALEFITNKHSSCSDNQHHYLPALLGWSQGALVAQLFAQKSPQSISKLILYGSIYDPLISYPPVPLYVDDNNNKKNDDENDVIKRQKNTFNSAIEDFTIHGSIPPEPATKFAQAALLSDPYKASWSYLSQFNNLDPARISIPTLVVAGDQDPYAPIRVQASLFENLGRGADRTWSIIADADHAVHLLDEGRERFVNIVTSFVENSKKGETLF